MLTNNGCMLLVNIVYKRISFTMISTIFLLMIVNVVVTRLTPSFYNHYSFYTILCRGDATVPDHH
jgi:hypothetical protein